MPIIANILTETIWPIVLLILGFEMVIFVHELGHFLVAKWCGIKVERFSLGFGPKLLGFKWGETEYLLSLLPLGGYVKMLGQEDIGLVESETNPRAFNNKSISARAAVVSAGVIMNLISGAILFMLVFTIGLRVPPPEVGEVLPGTPAHEAGLKMGEVIITANGHHMLDFGDLTYEIIVTKTSRPVILEVRDPRTMEVRQVSVQAKRNNATGLPQIGTTSPASLLVAVPKNSDLLSPATPVREEDDVESMDRIVAAGGRSITEAYELYEILTQAHGDEVPITIEHHDQSRDTMMARMRMVNFGVEAPTNLLGMRPGTMIGDVVKESPAAKAGLLPGDYVTAIGDYKKNPTITQFMESTKSNSTPLLISVFRDGEHFDFTVTPKRGGWLPWKKTIIGVQLMLADHRPVVAEVLEGSAAEQFGIPRDSIITKINGQAVTHWGQMAHEFESNAGEDIVVNYELDGIAGQAAIPAAATAATSDGSDWRHQIMWAPDFGNAMLYPKTEILRSNPIAAVGLGAKRTYRFIVRTYQTLASMARRDVSPKNLVGPVGIVNIGTDIASRDLVMLLYFLALISVNLAVINFLPLPIVDGGLMVFLLVEKLKGSPVSLRIQGIAQMVGITMIIGVFLFVTYHDLVRLIQP